MELQSKRSQSRLGWAMVGGVAVIAIVGLVLARVTFRPPTRPAALFQVAGPPVLLITIDTLRADHVGCYGARMVQTPNMDSLAADGARFDDALAQVPMTLPSHTAILTGTYPMWNGVRDMARSRLRPDAGLMSEAFQRHGYETAAFVSSYVLDSGWGLSRGFETYDDRFDPNLLKTQAPEFVERRAEETVDHALSWFQAHDPAKRDTKPFFVWLHLYDPHTPYNPPEPFHSQYAKHLYDGEIAYADSQLGRLFDYLRQAGAYDRTLMVLLSDHGESLGEHGEDEHGFFIYRSTLRVPLIIKPPRSTAAQGEARVVEGTVGALDVAPTLLELAHLQDPISRQFEGRSLASLVLGKSARSEQTVYSESYYSRDSFGWSPLRSVSTARDQFIEAPRPELYDVPADPSEIHNLYGRRAADTAALRAQLQDIERHYTDQAAPSGTGSSLSAEAVEKLKSLGYVAYSAPSSTSSEKDLPDPKDELQGFKAYMRAQALANAGKFKESDALLKAWRAKDPNQYLIVQFLGANALSEHRPADAKVLLRESLKLNPTFSPAIMMLGQIANSEGNFDEARTWYELEISNNPQNFLAYYHLGQIAHLRMDMGEAQRDFEKAVALKTDYSDAQHDLGMVLMETNQFKEAVKPLEEAASFGSDDAPTFNALGTAYLNTNQPQKAIQAFQKALAKGGDSTPAHLNLAMAYLKAGDRTNARNEFRTACAEGGPQCEQYEKLFQ